MLLASRLQHTEADATPRSEYSRPLFVRDEWLCLNALVLDQSYYPDSVMTAPSDEALIRDIELAKRVGFCGARLHQKVFEERFSAAGPVVELCGGPVSC